MTSAIHSQLKNDIWSICNLLRGPYKRNEYRKVILPLTVLRRFDCLLVPTKEKVLEEYKSIKSKPEKVIWSKLHSVTKRPFYNLSKLDFEKLLNDPNQIAANLNSYINSFSPNVREIFDRFKFEEQVAKMNEKNLLFQIIQKFSTIDLSPKRVDNMQMGYVFEELIRIGAEQANEEAGEHFTPREVIKLMVNLLLAPEKDLAKSHVVKTIYDPACGTGGMLSVAEAYIKNLNSDAKPNLYGQDWNDEAWAICKADMLIKGEDAENIVLNDTFTKDGFDRKDDGTKWTFDYMLANPPFGVEWKQQQRFIEKERDTLGYDGRFGAGTPRVNDGALLFLQHMISKMRSPKDGGSRIGIVFNGSPLFTGDAGASGESAIRQWIIENDWLESVIALPDQLFYNTGISTYIWILTNHKEKERKGKVQLIDARNFYEKMDKSLGNKRKRIADPEHYPNSRTDQVNLITKIYGNFKNDETYSFSIDGKKKNLIVSKVFDNEDFGYRKIVVERPLKLNFQFSDERIERLKLESGFQRLATSKKKNPKERLKEIEDGETRQKQIIKTLDELKKTHGDDLIKSRPTFLEILKEADKSDGLRLAAPEIKFIVNALSERDETAEVVTDRHGNPEPDPALRDTEYVPLKESIAEFIKREVTPHAQDAWPDESKEKIGYEIPFNRHFYVYESPRSLAEIDGDLNDIESEILNLLKGLNP